VTDSRLLEEELSRVARQGFAIAPEEAMLGINAVAAPIFNDMDACVGALALVGSIQFLPAEPGEKCISALKAAAAQISRMFGHGRSGGAPETPPARRMA
jgi:DNA-binding IclR family transcriptional regulator